MPYGVNQDLPSSVRDHLPEHAQDIFREAFNHAYDAHERDPRQEEAAFESPGRRSSGALKRSATSGRSAGRAAALRGPFRSFKRSLMFPSLTIIGRRP